MRIALTPLTLALIILLLAMAVTSIAYGPMQLGVKDSLATVLDKVFDSELSEIEQHQKFVITDLRLPRTLLAIFVGVLLAQSGAVLQGIFRNPLADPGIIGISSGAALGAVLAIAFISSELGALPISISAFVGGLGTTILVYSIARSINGTSVVILLLSGVAISAFCAAVIGFISYFADNQSLRHFSLWQMGSLDGPTSDQLWLVFVVMVFLLVSFQRNAVGLNALALGEAEANHLGINVEMLKRRLIILSAIGVGVAVSAAGLIGFIALIVPHMIRLLIGPDHKVLLPLSALAGALLLLAADIFSRWVFAPTEIPVGLVTALLGTPFFVYLLVSQRSSWISK